MPHRRVSNTSNRNHRRTCRMHSDPAWWPQTAASSVKMLELLMDGKQGVRVRVRGYTVKEGDSGSLLPGRNYICTFMRMPLDVAVATSASRCGTRPFFGGGGRPTKQWSVVWVTLEFATILIDIHILIRIHTANGPAGVPAEGIRNVSFSTKLMNEYGCLWKLMSQGIDAVRPKGGALAFR